MKKKSMGKYWDGTEEVPATTIEQSPINLGGIKQNYKLEN